MTIENLKALCEGEGLTYFVAPNRPTVTMGFGGFFGRFQIVVPVELDGRFLQFRTVGYLHCPADHPNLLPVLKAIGEVNYALRLVKFGWDPSDGEIVGYVDVFIEDGEMTQQMFSACLHCLIPAVDFNHRRLSQIIETGTDPGDLAREDSSGAGLPPDVRAVLERIAARRRQQEPGEDPAQGEGKGKGKDPGSGDDPFPTV